MLMREKRSVFSSACILALKTGWPSGLFFAQKHDLSHFRVIGLFNFRKSPQNLTFLGFFAGLIDIFLKKYLPQNNKFQHGLQIFLVFLDNKNHNKANFFGLFKNPRKFWVVDCRSVKNLLIRCNHKNLKKPGF